MGSCSNTKYLAKNQRLLIANNYQINGELLLSEKQELANSLASRTITLQQPNYKTARIARAGLWLYNRYDSTKFIFKMFGWLINKKWLKPPVIYDSSLTKQSVANMEGYLRNVGYFLATADYKEKIKNQKVSVTYLINTNKGYVFDKIDYDIPDSTIRQVVLGSKMPSLIQPGALYKQATLSGERERLTKLIRNAGYYKFSNRYIEFELDTLNKALFRDMLNPFEHLANVFASFKNRERPKLDITIRVRNPEDSMAVHERYTINHIYVYPDFSIDGDPKDTTYKESEKNEITIRYKQDLFKPSVLNRAIFYKKGDLYSVDNYSATVNKFNELGVWDYVNVQFEEADSNQLNSYILLVPKKRQEIGANIEGTTSTDYLIGYGVSFNYRNLNANRAANQLNASIKAGVESNFDTLSRKFYMQALDYSAQLNMRFPRFITPFRLRHVSRRSSPSTSVGLLYNYQKRIDLYDLTNVNTYFGYDWKETPQKSWVIRPLTLNYFGAMLSPGFGAKVDTVPILKRSFESSFYGGEAVSFTYNNQDIFHKRHYSFIQANIEESGLLLSGIDQGLTQLSSGNTSLQKMTMLKLSQFIRTDVDIRHYLNFARSSMVGRFYAGIGIPVGRSDVLPFVKQFSAGGPNSLRAWRLRSLGPGSYKDPNPQQGRNVFYDQTGEMKLEGNVEYRFNIFKLFGGAILVKGALFTDVGNIWMLNPDPSRPGAEFKLNSLMQQLAVGAGTGLRFDLSFFVVRLDAATPLKQPYLPDYGWVLNQINLGSSAWRRENIILNFAIGYPF